MEPHEFKISKTELRVMAEVYLTPIRGMRAISDATKAVHIDIDIDIDIFYSINWHFKSILYIKVQSPILETLEVSKDCVVRATKF